MLRRALRSIDPSGSSEGQSTKVGSEPISLKITLGILTGITFGLPMYLIGRLSFSSAAVVTIIASVFCFLALKDDGMFDEPNKPSPSRRDRLAVSVPFVVILVLATAGAWISLPSRQALQIQSRLETWARETIRPVAAAVDGYTRYKILNKEWSDTPADNIQREMEATVTFQPVGTVPKTYQMYVRVAFVSRIEPILGVPWSSMYKPFDKYAEDIFIGSALEVARRAYVTGDPPVPIAEVQVALWKESEYRVTVSPATPYKAEETRVERKATLLYMATVDKAEILKAEDWGHFSNYCHENPTFFFTQVCRNVQRPSGK